MADKRKRHEDELTDEEIAKASAEPLPDREAMSVMTVPGSHPGVPVEPGLTIMPIPPDEV